MKAQREIITAQRERDYERFVAYRQHAPEKEAQPATPEVPYRAAETLIDYHVIEQRAAELIEAHEFSPKTPWQGEYEANARTAIFEALSSSGHLSRIELHGSPEEVNEKTLERWLNAMHRVVPDHELKRGFREICEELVIQEVQRLILAGELPPDTEVATESVYPDSLEREVADQIGYRWRNKKGMTRSTGFTVHDDGTITRIIEQVNYSQSSADEVIARRQQEGLPVRRSDAADIDVLGASVIYSRTDIAEGVVGIQRRIDAFKGANIRFGEQPDETTPSYEALRELSALRESQVERFVRSLAQLEAELDDRLAAGSITQAEHDQYYHAALKTIRREICLVQPEYIAEAIGANPQLRATYQQAYELLLAGDSDGAADAIESVAHLETELVVCGLGEQQAQQQDEELEQALLRQNLKKMQETLIWVRGKCRIELCPSKGKIVEVAQCFVCRECQAHFDADDDPREIYAAAQAEAERQVAIEADMVVLLAEPAEITKLRFEEIVGVGSATLIAYDGERRVAEGEEALRLRREG